MSLDGRKVAEAAGSFSGLAAASIRPGGMLSVTSL